MSETVSVDFPDDLLDEMDARIGASFDHENRSQYIRAAVRRMNAEPGELDVTAGRNP